MLTHARDILSICFLEKRLSILRENYLAQVVDGKQPDPEYFAKGEEAIMQQAKRKFYNSDVRLVVKPSDADNIDDEQDFADREQKLAEHAMFFTHRKLNSIPFVGHPDYDES